MLILRWETESVNIETGNSVNIEMENRVFVLILETESVNTEMGNREC